MSPRPGPAYLPNLSSASMHGTAEVIGLSSVSWIWTDGYNQANMKLEAWGMFLKITLYIDFKPTTGVL